MINAIGIQHWSNYVLLYGSCALKLNMHCSSLTWFMSVILLPHSSYHLSYYRASSSSGWWRLCENVYLLSDNNYINCCCDFSGLMQELFVIKGSVDFKQQPDSIPRLLSYTYHILYKMQQTGSVYCTEYLYNAIFVTILNI